jgi:hypothetical protein
MVGVTKANFEDVFPDVESTVKKADFIGTRNYLKTLYSIIV